MIPYPKQWFKGTFTVKRFYVSIILSAILLGTVWVTETYEKALKSDNWVIISIIFALVTFFIFIFSGHVLDIVSKDFKK